MAVDRPTLLLTRPEASARRFLVELRAAPGGDLPAVISPLMAPRFLDIALPVAASIVFTSETAVRAVARLGPDRSPVAWCVGPRTAAAARSEGYGTVEGGGTAEDLAREMVAQGPVGRVFCPVARNQAFDIEKAFSSAGMDVVAAVVYAQEPCPPTAEALALMAGDAPVILPLFSVRSAHLAAAAFRDHRAPLRIVAMSAAIADAASALRPERTNVATSPDAPALIRAILPLTRP